MPYIDHQARSLIDGGCTPLNAGQLNYAITKLALAYIDAHGPLSYQLINDVMGALTGAQQEFYRRVAAPYEDQKMRINGDVY